MFQPGKVLALSRWLLQGIKSRFPWKACLHQRKPEPPWAEDGAALAGCCFWRLVEAMSCGQLPSSESCRYLQHVAKWYFQTETHCRAKCFFFFPPIWKILFIYLFLKVAKELHKQGGRGVVCLLFFLGGCGSEMLCPLSLQQILPASILTKNKQSCELFYLASGCGAASCKPTLDQLGGCMGAPCSQPH